MLDTSRLRTQLQERLDRVLGAHHLTIVGELGSLLRFIEEKSLLSGALQGLRDECPEFDHAAWVAENFKQDQIRLPATEPCRARLYEGILREAVAAQQFIVSITRHMSNGQLAERVEVFNAQFVEPFVRLIDDRLEEGNFLLELLVRYRHDVGWFRRQELSEAAGRSGSSEKVLDTDLRHFLFEMGIDYPFSQPASPSGKPDVVVGGDDPQPIEVKLYDAQRGYGAARVRDGVRQAYDYAGDFGHGVGYLVVFNFEQSPLEFPNDGGEGTWPPRLIVGNRTIYMIAVDLEVPSEPASKRPPVDPIQLSRAQLVPADRPADA